MCWLTTLNCADDGHVDVGVLQYEHHNVCILVLMMTYLSAELHPACVCVWQDFACWIIADSGLSLDTMHCDYRFKTECVHSTLY